ncbi:MAG: methyltransferase domain-containing protein [Elusimicrobiota bacterium]
MKLSAYMFIRNGIRGGYTFMEAIENVLPFVDEFFILEGKSADGTLEALEAMAKLNAKVRIESETPAYVNAPKDKKGLLLGSAFEAARRKCNGDWLIQVQADTVFHPITVFASRYFLERDNNALKYDGIEVVRRQYRWNWQDMYRKDNLALIFRKKAGEVYGDALNVEINGRISRRFIPLFEKFPVADNAWIFFENITGKQEGCREIWATPENHGKGRDFPWYDRATGRSFAADLDAYRQKGELPPFWLEKNSPFKAGIPSNLAGLVGLKKYGVAERFKKSAGLYKPSAPDIAQMLAAAGDIRAPLREKVEDALVSAGFAPILARMRKNIRRRRKVLFIPRQSSGAQKGEIEFRRKLSSQQVAGEKIFEDEFDGPGIIAILEARMRVTMEDARFLKDSGVIISPYLEIGAERCQRALVMENDMGASGLAVDLSFDMLRSCAHYMDVFNKAKSPLRVCCDAGNLPFLPNSLPFVFCCQTLHHFPDPGPVINEALRVLSPGGHFAFYKEPFRQTLHINLYKGRKIYSREAARPGSLADILNFFFSEINCNEVGHGVIENNRITLSMWKRALAGFEGKQIRLCTIKKLESELFNPSSRIKFLAAWLFGGEIGGLCRKAGAAPESYPAVEETLACPACREKGLESGLMRREAFFACSACASSFPVVDGALFLFPAGKFRELYPEIFLKADVKT